MRSVPPPDECHSWDSEKNVYSPDASPPKWVVEDLSHPREIYVILGETDAYIGRWWVDDVDEAKACWRARTLAKANLAEQLHQVVETESPLQGDSGRKGVLRTSVDVSNAKESYHKQWCPSSGVYRCWAIAWIPRSSREK